MVDSIPPLVNPQVEGAGSPLTQEAPLSAPPPAAVPVSTSQTVPNIAEAKVSDTLGSAEYAGFGARFLASTVDGMIVSVIYFVLMIPVFILIGVTAASGVGREPGAGISILMLLFQGMGWILAVGYYIYFTAKGQTLGKKALKIKVVRVESGEAPGYTKAFLREVVGKMVSAMVFGLGYLWILWDGKKQTWHDKIAGTVVVKA